MSDGDTGSSNRPAYRVLARQYRPQTFTEVVGQDAVVRTLTNAIESGRVAHAFLFCGTRGVGKTTMARLLAKALNCEQGPTTSPCNACDPCREITAGASVDVLEIDGASHNKVDDVRELQESLSYHPVRDRHRVIIIDEVHMLSRSAFNALLKTLEEPPGHVVFIMATTELEKIPATILSRCQHFTFRRIRRGDIEGHLAALADKEDLEVSPRALSLVAREAAGSMRDALSALDQLVSFCGKSIADDEAETVLGALPLQRVDTLLECVAEQDTGGALKALRASEDRGDDPHRFAAALLSRLRDLSVLSAVGDDTDLVDVGDDERKALGELAKRLGDDALIRLFQLVSELELSMRHSRQPRLMLELAALRMVKAADLTPLTEIAASLAGGSGPPAGSSGPQAGGRGPTRDRSGPTGRSASPTPGARSASATSPRQAAPAAAPPAVQQAPAPTPARGPVPASTDAAFDLDALRSAVELERPAAAAFLEHAEGGLADGVLTLTWSSQQTFFKKSMEMAANMEPLERAAHGLLGQVDIQLALSDRVGKAAVATDSPERPKESPADRNQRLRKQVVTQPAARALNEIFGAEMVDIQPIEPGDGSRAETDR